MDALEAIRRRRSVRTYTDRPVDDADLDQLLRLALMAPTGGMAQAWSLMVIREPERRAALAEIVIAGGGAYFASVRPAAPGHSPAEHRQWGLDYANEVLGSYRHVPVWILGLVVPRNLFPPEDRDMEALADEMSVAFAMENLFVAARAKGLGTVPTVFHWYNEPALRELVGLPDEIRIPVITPLGYPTEFPVGLPPRLKELRRPWRTLVHDETWGSPRAE
jgi:nitroreductase